MLDGFDTYGSFFQGGSSCSFGDIWRNGPDADGFGHICADEDNTRIDRGGPKNSGCVFAPEEALAANRRLV